MTPRLASSAIDAVHGSRNVEEFQVGEDPLVSRQQPVDELEVATGRHQLKAELVEAHGIAELFGNAPGLGGIGNVEGEDQAIAGIGAVTGDWHGG